MFYLKPRTKGEYGNAKDKDTVETGEDGFGWWLSDGGPGSSRRFKSSSSSCSMLSCIDSDDAENYTLARESDEIDEIEELSSSSSDQDRCHIDLIEEDFRGESRGTSYTPERLIRSQEYRIRVPPPRYLSMPECDSLPDFTHPQRHQYRTDSSSQDDTSGIQSNSWSSDTCQGNITPCLCNELAKASKDFIAAKLGTELESVKAINEVASILQGLGRDPDSAMALLTEEQPISRHDPLTRLALAIESDGNGAPILGDSEHLICHLHGKLERLRLANKDIYKDIRILRKDFQNDERRLNVLSSNTTKLRQNVQELRYLDDLLNLLRGELGRISCKEWPFAVGHREGPKEEINLII